MFVTLHARVWIETIVRSMLSAISSVTLHARVWIETLCILNLPPKSSVTLHARVWIETKWNLVTEHLNGSPSTRGCGLKLPTKLVQCYRTVTLHARVWIETCTAE